MFANTSRIWSSLKNQDLRIINLYFRKSYSKLGGGFITRGQHYDNFKRKSNRMRATTYNVIPKPKRTGSIEERNEYESIFPDIVKDLEEFWPNIPEAKERCFSMIWDNVPNHRQAPGFATSTAFKMFASPQDITSQNIRLAHILGWCIDMSICQFQMTDDIMDASEFRRGIPCWYKNKDVGLQAISDSILVECAIFQTLRKNFSKLPCYVPILEWFQEISLTTSLGQALDNMSTVNGIPRLEAFTMEKYKALAKYKGSYGEFVFAAILALHLSGKYNTELQKQTTQILLELGEFFTAQNDILDCYGDPAITGKVGTDIRQGKLTWLVVVAMQRATPSQIDILRKHYGKPQPESELEVRSLYENLDVLDTFLQYEEESFSFICKMIQQISDGRPQEYFFRIVESVYGQERLNYVPSYAAL